MVTQPIFKIVALSHSTHSEKYDSMMPNAYRTTPVLQRNKLQQYRPFHLLKVEDMSRYISIELNNANAMLSVTVTESASYVPSKVVFSVARR